MKYLNKNSGDDTLHANRFVCSLLNTYFKAIMFRINQFCLTIDKFLGAYANFLELHVRGKVADTKIQL